MTWSFVRLFHQLKKAAHGEFGVDITSKVVAARYNLMIKSNLDGLRIVIDSIKKVILWKIQTSDKGPRSN